MGLRVGAVDAQDGGAIVREEEPAEGSLWQLYACCFSFCFKGLWVTNLEPGQQVRGLEGHGEGEGPT